jgi:hypothetical protein
VPPQNALNPKRFLSHANSLVKEMTRKDGFFEQRQDMAFADVY